MSENYSQTVRESFAEGDTIKEFSMIQQVPSIQEIASPPLISEGDGECEREQPVEPRLVHMDQNSVPPMVLGSVDPIKKSAQIKKLRQTLNKGLLCQNLPKNIDQDPEKTMDMVKKEFYDDRAKEMRQLINIITIISYFSNILQLASSGYDLEKIVWISYNFIIIIPCIISYKNQNMDYVRFSNFMLIFKESIQMFMLDYNDFVGVENLSINGKSFVFHILLQICITTFNMIYTDKRRRLQQYVGFFTIVFFSYSVQQAFFIDDKNMKDHEEIIGLAFMGIFMSMIAYLYVKVCQNVIEQMFQQIQNNIEQYNIIQSILNNLEESILITNETKNIDYLNDKFFEQFSPLIPCDEIEEKEEKVNQPEIKSCWKSIKKCNKKAQKEQSENQFDQAWVKSFFKQKILAKFRQIPVNESYDKEDDDPQFLSFEDILNSDEKSLEKMIVYTEIKNDQADLTENSIESEYRYLQIKLKKYCRNHQALTMIQFIDISDSILYDQQKAQNHALEMINASVSHEMRNPLNSINAQNILKHELYKELNRMMIQFEQETNAQNLITQKNKFLIKFKKIMGHLNNGYMIQESSTCILTHIVQDLLDFAQIKAGKFRKNINDFNIIDIVNQVMLIQQRKAQDNNIQLQAHFQSSCNPVITTDKQRVMQVLLGLQSNALKFTKDGRVDINIEIVQSSMGNDYLQIQVADTGIGISQQNQKNLFKLFGMVQESRSLNTTGVGLGLVISKQIVNQFGGSIILESEVGIGSKFTFTFQLEKSQAKDSKEIHQILKSSNEIDLKQLNDKNLHFKWCPANREITKNQRIKYIRNLDQQQLLQLNFREEIYSESSQSDEILYQSNLQFNSIRTIIELPEKFYLDKKILIVDDQSFNIDALMIILKYKIGLNSKFYCQTALSGLQAIEIIKKDIAEQKNKGKNKSKFQLILMDCNMPELDGYETTQKIRQMLWDNKMVQPIISAVTGHTEQLHINMAIDAGMNLVISKPVEYEILNYLLQMLKFPLNKLK